MTNVNEDFLNYMAQYITEHKKELIEEVLSRRTRHITVVLEDIYQAQNASAVLRTCDCYGIQDIHIIEDRHVYDVNPKVVHGASKWITLHRHNESEDNSLECFNKLKEEGYKIIATVPDESATSIFDIDISEKTALVFGTEKHGISDFMKHNADQLTTIPMYGFTESLNISVSAAICISALAEKLFSSEVKWHLREEEKTLLRYLWYKGVVHRPEVLEREFFKK